MSNEIQNSNLLANSAFLKFQKPLESKSSISPSVGNSAVSNPVVLQPQPTSDIYQVTPSEGSAKASFEKYSGPAALLVSVIGLPVTYVAAKKSAAKSFDNLRKPMENLLNEFKNLNIDKKIEEAVSKVVKNTDSKSKGVVPAANVLTSIFVGLGSGLGIAEFVKGNKDKLKEHGFSDDDISVAQKTATTIVDSPKQALDAANEVKGVVNEAKVTAYEAKNTAYSARDAVGSFDQRITDAHNKAIEAVKATELGLDPMMQMYTVRHFDLNLLQVINYEKKIDLNKTPEVLDNIHNAAIKRLDRTARDTLKDIKAFKEKFPELTSTWSLTAEYAPIKTGGLGVVPVDLQDNFTKLGIDSPVFIPMYLKKNQSEFIELPNNQYKYVYGNETFNLTKMAETRTHVFRNGQTQNENIEYYVTEVPIDKSKPLHSPSNSKTLVFIKTNDYFNDNIYDSTTNAEETERFALFAKSVYKLAKVKVNMALDKTQGKKLKTGLSDLRILDQETFDKIKAPNSMILNDWHAGSMASLLRYRAPMEYNYNEIPKSTYEALKDMPLLMIGHNLRCQGNSNSGNGSILRKNRVAENIINTLYDSYAIAITEHAHSGISSDENDDMCNTVLLKRRTADKHFNHLFNGVALSDWFVPVSKNYTTEVTNDPGESGILYPLLQRRKNSGTIGGIINGLDKVNVDMVASSQKNYVDDLTLQTYDKDTPIEDIIERRLENKKRFYNKFVKIARSFDGKDVIGKDVTFDEQEFIDSPVISFAHRLTGQKGLGIFKGAIFRLYDNWEDLFPGKKMPICIVGGAAEASEELQHLYDLKNEEYGSNKERVNRILAIKGNMPNPAIMSASTFFCAPSTYEPCGLTQGECFAKGTPVIATDVGGFHDTIVDGKTGFLAPEVNEESFYNKLVEALTMYFERPEDYKAMIQEDLNVDFSWAQAGKRGSIYEYTDKLGFNRKNLPDIAVAA